MKINADFDQRIVVHSVKLPWLDSPIKGVQRRMLDRIGGEVARATSIVRYAPGVEFSPHVHTGGEEFIVLDGVFQDEHGDYPAGTYVRNPPQSQHKPGSKIGCTIFVKLWQFNLADRTPVTLNFNEQLNTRQDRVNRTAVDGGTKTDTSSNRQEDEDKKPHNIESSILDCEPMGLDTGQRVRLFANEQEDVRVERWLPGETVALDTSGGAELLVLNGDYNESLDTMKPLSWQRLPIGYDFQAQAGKLGAQVWIKTGHLRFVTEPIDT